jgi:hypothetical protein
VTDPGIQVLDIAQPGDKAAADRRVLGVSPAVLSFALAALIITAAILFLQIQFRAGQWDPELLPVFRRLFAFEDYWASFLFIGVLLLAATPRLQDAAATLARAMGKHPVAVALIATTAFASGSLWIYHAHPLAMDESAPYMQSKIFAAGALHGQYPPDLIDWLTFQPFQGFFVHVSHTSGEIASTYWPGFAMLLTPFMAAGVPWLCNPVIGGLSVLAIHRLTRQITNSDEAAGLAALFTVASAAFDLNAMSFYSMPAHLLCSVVFALLLLEPSPARALLAGLVGGLALNLHNPVPHMLFAPPWLLWLAMRKNRWPLLGAIAVGYLPWIIIGFEWRHFLRELADPAIAASTSTSALGGALGDLATVLKLPGQYELLERLIALSKLWLWAAPLLLLLAGIGFWRHRQNIYIRLLLASFALTFIGYLFVPLNQGHGWGFRYLHSVWFALPVLGAAAFVPSPNDSASSSKNSRALIRLTSASAVLGLLVIVPYFSWQVYSYIGHHLAQLPTASSGTPRVIIISTAMTYYSQDLVQNDPFLRAPPMRFISHGRKRDEQFMQQRFPNLTLLARDFRGSVWGDADPAAAHSQGIPR